MALHAWLFVTEKEGKEVEKEMNEIGPGEAMFVACDVTKEEDIKVRQYSLLLWLVACFNWLHA